MDRLEVERAVALAGLELPADADYEVVGAEPVLRSPHRLATGASVARLLSGLAAADLWRLRTGRVQHVGVDVRHAAASLLSFQYARPDGEPEQSLEALARRTGDMARRRLTRIVAARDGRYVQLHGSFHDGAQILAELGLDADASVETVDAAVARRDAAELEAAFVARGVCGGMVRTRDEWAAHSQGRAIAELPVVTITRIGEAPAEQLPTGDRPASGVRVLDLTRVLAGPTCAKTIAEHGADVLHVSTPLLEPGGPFEMETGIGKRQAALDLDDPAQAETLRALVADADVFVQGYRLGALDRRGFSPRQLASVRPGIVYVSENCYGHVGPWAQRPGWEQLAQAATGMSHREGIAGGGAPRLAPAAVNDYTTGFLAAYGALVALARRATEGGSWLVQASLCQTAMWYQRLGDDNDMASARLGDVTAFTCVMDGPDFGAIRYLTPALRMSETPPRWDLPPRKVGTHRPEWLPRER
jgi:crotonobetainyl-CoA:carnitine CoA-transferase CaiB-like acyl-CoA transferase